MSLGRKTEKQNVEKWGTFARYWLITISVLTAYKSKQNRRIRRLLKSRLYVSSGQSFDKIENNRQHPPGYHIASPLPQHHTSHAWTAVAPEQCREYARRWIELVVVPTWWRTMLQLTEVSSDFNCSKTIFFWYEKFLDLPRKDKKKKTFLNNYITKSGGFFFCCNRKSEFKMLLCILYFLTKVLYSHNLTFESVV